MASVVKTPGTKADEIPDAAITIDDSGDGKSAATAEGAADEARMKQVRGRFQIMLTFWSEIHTEGLNDDRFIAGEQWDPDIKKERQDDRRPVLTYNLLPAFNRQITNRVRQDRPAVKVTPVETSVGADPRMSNMAGTKDYSLAEVYAGIIKNIEHVSRADQAYDTAVKHAVDHGFGFFYLIPQWSKIDPFVQELVIHRVKNSYSVMLDPDAQEADYRDMQDGFLHSNINKETFKAKYPGKSFTEFTAGSTGAFYEGWYDTEHVRVAQYFWLDYQDDEVLRLSNGKTVWFSKVKDGLNELEREHGIHIVKDDEGEEMRKPVKRPVCMWQKMTADEILEGPLELPFSSVPIFPVLGEEVMVDGRIRYESAIRHAKDAQKSYNYWRTAAAETVALAPRAPWMATEAQIKGHEEMYEQANTRNLPYMFYNHIDNIPPPQRVSAKSSAAAELQNATQDGMDMQTIIGLHDANLGRESNEKSGKAINARKESGSTSTFQFPDNLGRALEQCGRCEVEAIPQLYDSNRQVRIRLPDTSDDFILVNETVKDGGTGKEILIHDIAYGKYDVTLDTGASYATQRQEAADLQMELLKVLGPERAANIVHLIVQNLGVPGSEEVAAVMRKMLPDALKTEDEKMADLPKGVSKDPQSGQLVDEDGKPWQPEPTLEQQLQQKTNEVEEFKAKAEMAKHQATSDKAAADTKQAEADLANAELELAALQQPGAGDAGNPEQIDGMMNGIKEIIEQTMREHSQDPGAHDAMDIEDKIAAAIVDALQRVRGYVDRTVKAGDAVPGEAGAPGGNQSDTKQAAAGTGLAPVILSAVPVAQEASKPDRVKITPNKDGTMIAEPEWDNKASAPRLKIIPNKDGTMIAEPYSGED